MDYEKKYKEALERAKEMISNECSSEHTKTVCQEIFPQLAESEDERTREDIMHFLYAWRGDTKVEKWLAWLEKQKPAEWSEEDGYRIRWIISLLTTMQEKGIDDRYGDSVHDDIPDMISWLKSLRQQPRHEWSEKDERFICNLIRYFKGEEALRYTDEETINWLKSLRPQQITDWSEEDKDNFSAICEIIKCSTTIPYINGLLTLSDNYKRELLDWLKNLRPNHWKPSEEQMAILERVVNDLKTKFTGATVKEQLTLESLYDELERLING